MNLMRRSALCLSIAPAVALLMLLFYVPLAAALYQSVADRQRGITLAAYDSLLRDASVRHGLLFSLEYALASTAAAFIYGMIWAALMRRAFPGKRWFGILSRAPVMIPGIAVALMMLTLLEQGGFLARALAPLGIVLPRIVRGPGGIGTVIGLAWKEAPLMGTIVAAAFGSLRPDVLQAARSLGAGPWRAFWLIQIPAAMPGLAAAAILGFVRALGAFAIPSLLGPAYPKPILVLLYEAFEYGDWPRVYTIGILFATVTLFVAWLYHRAMRAIEGGERGRSNA
jgi:putative spermidine/putrescine transport system permease protein